MNNETFPKNGACNQQDNSDADPGDRTPNSDRALSMLAWSAPRNLGPDLNTAGGDDVPTISPDGRYWFFEKNNDIYWRESPLLPPARP